MKVVGNIFWLIFGGLEMALVWFLGGCLLCITIIGIPFGKQCFKFARMTLAPFGADPKIDFGSHPIMNVIWLIFFGWELAVGCFFFGVIFFITIIGIPFGKQWMKLAKLSLFPFGAKVD